MVCRSIFALTVLTLAGVTSAAAVSVNVDSHSGPWISGSSGTPSYGSGDNAAPTIVLVTAGTSIKFKYLLGLTSAYGANAPEADATGYAGPPHAPFIFDASNGPGSSNAGFPSGSADPTTYPIYLNALIADFVDDTGAPIVLPSGAFAFAPFASDILPFSITVPTGATRLQLGINDDIFSDNSGFLTIDIEGRGVSAVPGPIVGAGIPGLVMAFGGLLAWRRRKAIAT